MDGMFLLILLIAFLLGVRLGWKQLTDGTGLVGSRLSKKTLKSLNEDTTEAKVKKGLLAALLGYFIFGWWLMKYTFKLAMNLADGKIGF